RTSNLMFYGRFLASLRSFVWCLYGCRGWLLWALIVEVTAAAVDAWVVKAAVRSALFPVLLRGVRHFNFNPGTETLTRWRCRSIVKPGFLGELALEFLNLLLGNFKLLQLSLIIG